MTRGFALLLTVGAVTAAGAVSGSDRTPGPSAGPAISEWGVASAPGPVRRPLPFFYDLYTFRGNAGATSVVAAFAIPAGRLQRESVDGDTRYRFDVTLVLADTTLGTVSRTDDSVFVGVPRALSGDHLLHTHIEVEAPPSSSTMQRVIMTDATIPGVGQLYGFPFPIPDYRGTHLMLSDIAMGLPDATEGWTRGDVTLALLPTSQFPEGSFDVYYEIYNLATGNEYATEISVEPVDEYDEGQGDATNTVRTTFTGESAADEGGSLAELRRIDTRLPKGRYRLTVTVTDAGSGQTAQGSRLFEVRGWQQGTTLVPALPASRLRGR